MMSLVGGNAKRVSPYSAFALPLHSLASRGNHDLVNSCYSRDPVDARIQRSHRRRAGTPGTHIRLNTYGFEITVWTPADLVTAP